jgi:hypothetical protein
MNTNLTIDNKYLMLKPGVILTPTIVPVIVRLEPYFSAANLFAFVTSGLRDSEAQLALVKKYLSVKGLDKLYPSAMVCKLNDKDGKHYVWQMAWSHLLNIGVIINPPLAAECLMDYVRNGKNKKGQVISKTPHHTGRCFDIGGAGGEDATINDELVVMNKAMNDKVPGLINILPEHNNNAIHCDCI